MPSSNRPVTLFLDYDGTLHESLHIYAPAFRHAYQFLVAQQLAPDRTFTDAEIGRWLGYTARDMWQTFLPQLAPQHQAAASRIVGAEMLRLIQQGQARLYPHAIEILQQLRQQQVTLVFLSNCSRPYLDAHRQYFLLDRYFSAFYCIADYPVTAKWQLYQQIQSQHSGLHIMVGDRQQDMDVAQHAQIPAIGCRYGYGTESEYTNATCTIDDIRQLPLAIQTILAAQR